MTRRQSIRGFSLVELIVAMTAGVVLTAMTLPGIYQTAQSYKASGSARALATQLALTKTRATAEFTQARLNVNAGAGSYTVEVWNKSLVAFVTEGGTQYLPAGSVLGYGSITTPPPSSQATIGQTALILFNSRGIPVDGTGTPTSTDALYVSDRRGQYFYAVTVSASSKVTLWKRDLRTNSWIKQ